MAIVKVKGGWGESSSFESLRNSLERDPQSSDTNALKLRVNAHAAVLLLIIQTTLKQLCEAVELQTRKERGTRDRAGCRQAGNQENSISAKNQLRQTHIACCTYRMAHMMEQLHQGPVAKARER